MKISTYEEFVQQVKQYKIFPFSDVIPEYPSLTSVVSDQHWHTGTELDPWLWRVRIVQDEHAAYGKFFGTKASFIQTDLFPSIKSLLTQEQSVEDRYSSGMMSKNARNIYNIINEAGRIDSRNLRKASGLTDKEQKKEYERALVELQNFADIVITGAQESDIEGGWSSMCFECSDHWLQETLGRPAAAAADLSEIKTAVKAEFSQSCTGKAMKYLDKKLKLA
ncbi:hypothetical protein FHS15_004087 [Paenibacillus castaneae]|uniref:AlkZ-related protein n=1 Tax=Paenibacillus castaneae TaxID=474957 RepID=UPI000C9C6641|nr:hypothetical protein [Paenibacillus castaneae]NIK78941.1 hypothetical protein [Paenibacillus castaneae]